MVDFGKCMQEAKFGIIAIVGISIVVTVLTFVPDLLFVAKLLGFLQFFVLNSIIFAYIGYKTAKKWMQIADSAITGGIAGLVAGIITTIIGLVMAFASGQGLMILSSAVVGVISIVLLTVVGLVFGAIGNLVAGKL